MAAKKEYRNPTRKENDAALKGSLHGDAFRAVASCRRPVAILSQKASHPVDVGLMHMKATAIQNRQT